MNFTPNKCQQTSIASCFFDTQKNKQSRFQNQQIPNTTRHLNHCHSFYQPSDQDLKKKFFQFTALTHQKIASNQNIVIQNVKYDVIRLIGQGNYGHVFLLKNDKTNELYAFKVQKQINKDEEKILLEFQGIKFKNLVNIIACLINVQTQEYFVLMEYCEQSLEDQLRQGKIDTKNVRYIMKSIANGIKELHDKNIIHRDIKPENILVFSITDGLNTQVCYKICDFGLSSTKSLSQTYRCGTSHYMAPEQIQCLKNKQIGYNNSVDIWALGAVIYELLTGDVFFMASSNDLIYELILNSDQESIDYKIKNKLGNLEYVNLLIKMMQIESTQRISIDGVISNLKFNGIPQFSDKINKFNNFSLLINKNYSSTPNLLINSKPQTNQQQTSNFQTQCKPCQMQQQTNNSKLFLQKKITLL